MRFSRRFIRFRRLVSGGAFFIFLGGLALTGLSGGAAQPYPAIPGPEPQAAPQATCDALTVTSTDDYSNLCGTLRYALNYLNTNPNSPRVINISLAAGSTINVVNTPLPLPAGVTLNGVCDAQHNPGITLNGSAVVGTGMALNGTSTLNCVKVAGFNSPQIRATTPGNSLNNTVVRSNPALKGPLRASPANPRYFSDPGGKIVYLTGSTTWASLQDNGGSDPPPVFDYQAYLNFLKANHHNFFRLYAWEQSRGTLETSDDNYWFYPLPYQRTGPGNALDGKPKFDLGKLNQAYFDRLRQRVVQAGQQGIYVSVMLFNGWSITSIKAGTAANNPWKGHPFNQANNINGVNGDLDNNNSGDEIQQLASPNATAAPGSVLAYQEAYVKKVIDTVGDLDNVLYEISNESNGGTGEANWQYHMVNLVHTYEATKPKQHPVGMTAAYPKWFDTTLVDSPADWISPDGLLNYPDSAAGSGKNGYKVVLSDTDHLCGICGDSAWAWKSFTQGQNPIFMDGYDGAGYGVGGSGFNFNDPAWVKLRLNLGLTRSYAGRMNLAAMQPHGELASSGYALANPVASGAEYLVYLPGGGSVNLDLSAAAGALSVEWFNPSDGTTYGGGSVTGGSSQNFTSPFNSSQSGTVLYLKGQ